MEGREPFSVAPETKFSDIIVPTIDTVRSSHILEMLLVNKKTVSRNRELIVMFEL